MGMQKVKYVGKETLPFGESKKRVVVFLVDGKEVFIERRVNSSLVDRDLKVLSDWLKVVEFDDSTNMEFIISYIVGRISYDCSVDLDHDEQMYEYFKWIYTGDVSHLGVKKLSKDNGISEYFKDIYGLDSSKLSMKTLIFVLKYGFPGIKSKLEVK